MSFGNAVFFFLSTTMQVLFLGESFHLSRTIVVFMNTLYSKGGIVVRILHHVHQVEDVCIFVPIRLFGEKAAWFHQAHDTEQLNLFYIMTGLTHHAKQISCTT